MIFPGKTLLVDMFGCDKAVLADKDRLYQLLIDLPPRIGMRAISSPMLELWDLPRAKEKADWGYSGTVLFAESHCYLHDWPDKGLLLFDLTSCKDFDLWGVVSELIKEFSPEKIFHKIVERGRGGSMVQVFADPE